MKQIGARQESGKVGGIGSCGRELCCSTWLTDFKSVNTTAARYQNLSINQTKLSGQCGRLKCCLNYELDTYMDALSVFPDHADHLETTKGVAHLQKRDIFKNLMWYSFSDNNKQYPLTITRVKEIQVLNKQGQKADDLQPVELETRDSKAGTKPDMGYINDVGSITLKNLEKSKKKKKSGGANKERAASGPQQGNRPQGNRPPQQAGGPQGNKPPQQVGGPQGAKPQGGDQPQGNRPQGNRPQGGGQQGNRPQQAKNPNQPQKQNQGQTPRPDNAGGPQKQNQPQQNRPPRPQQGNANQPPRNAERPPRNNPQQQQKKETPPPPAPES